MIEYLKNWGETHGFDTNVDETGNVIIRKPGTPGMENRKTVILQSHMDMVCDKLVDVEFDFDKDVIKTYIDGEWLTAEAPPSAPTTVSAAPSNSPSSPPTISSTVPSNVSSPAMKRRVSLVQKA